MKVLYISHHREKGGWSQAAQNTMMALDKAGVDVVARHVTLTFDSDIPNKIKEFEQKSTRGCDVCIQHVLPHHLTKTSKFKKNIAYLDFESTSIKQLSWFIHIQQMDEIWVPNSQSAQFLTEDGVGISVKVVPHAANIENYTKKYQDIDIPQTNNRFKFYYIGDLNDRKNIDTIVRCFHSEFDRSEPVSLVLKVKKFGHSPDKIRQILDQKIMAIKSSLRMYSNISEYHKDIVIAEDVDSDKVYALHQYCDCFMCPSHGEAWSIPSFEAMAFGKTPICSDFGGPKEFIDKDDNLTGSLVNGSYAVCQCSDSAFPDMFTGREYWFSPCDMQIRKAMRFYYDNQDKARDKKISGLSRAKRFSYENIGNLMKGLINE
jgi:glycosyltransferase involved in cell wall biosynthesis